MHELKLDALPAYDGGGAVPVHRGRLRGLRSLQATSTRNLRLHLKRGKSETEIRRGRRERGEREICGSPSRQGIPPGRPGAERVKAKAASASCEPSSRCQHPLPPQPEGAPTLGPPPQPPEPHSTSPKAAWPTLRAASRACAPSCVASASSRSSATWPCERPLGIATARPLWLPAQTCSEKSQPNKESTGSVAPTSAVFGGASRPRRARPKAHRAHRAAPRNARSVAPFLPPGTRSSTFSGSTGQGPRNLKRGSTLSIMSVPRQETLLEHNQSNSDTNICSKQLEALRHGI